MQCPLCAELCVTVVQVIYSLFQAEKVRVNGPRNILKVRCCLVYA